MRLILKIFLILLLLCLSAKAADTSKFVVYVPLGDQLSTPANPRCFGMPGNTQGIFDYNYVVDQWLEPLYTKAGFRRFLLWNPFGLSPTIETWPTISNGISVNLQTPQSIDAWLLLQQSPSPEYKVVIYTFVLAINRFKRNHSDAQVIVYNGTSMGCPRFKDLSPAEIVARLVQSLKPVFDTRCDMAFDSGCMIPPDHWLPKFFPMIEQHGAKVYVEAVPWRYDHLRTRGFVSALEQLQNATGANCQPQTPTTVNGGWIGYLDPATEIKGDRLGALFGVPPARFSGWLDWYKQVVPRAFNAGQIDGLCLHMNPFIGPPYSLEAITLPQLISSLDVTTDSNYGDYLQAN
jgi:hypothetical protein